MAVEFDDLEQQIKVFIENAYAQNYFAPNRVIPKNQRPKWRFLVKNFIKELEKIEPGDSNYARAVKLLTDIYALICQACNVYLFSTDDPFRSIGWEQDALFELVVRKTFVAGYVREDISRLLLLSVTGGLSMETLHINQEAVLIGGLKTRDAKYMAVEEVQKLIGERTGKLEKLKKYDSRRYHLEEEVNGFCDVSLLLSDALEETVKGVEYYFQHYISDNLENVLYHALRLLDDIDADEVWIQVYEYGMRHKIKSPDHMQAKYEQLKKQNS